MKTLNTKQGLKLFLKGLYSNTAAYEGSMGTPWWWALIIGFLAVMFSLVPTMVHYGTETGSSRVDNTAISGVELAQTRFVQDMFDKSIELTITESADGIKRITSEVSASSTWNTAYGTYDVSAIYSKPFQHVRTGENEAALPTQADFIDFEVYFLSDAVTDSNAADKTNDIIKNLLDGKLADGSSRDTDPLTPTYYQTNEKDEDGNFIEINKLRNSFVFFSRTQFDIYMVNRNGDRLSYYRGNYEHFEVGYSFTSLGNVTVKDVNGNEVHLTADKSIWGVPENRDFWEQYRLGVKKNFSGIYDLGYITEKYAMFWVFTGISFGVAVLLLLATGLVIWITTRGKKNPMSFITLGDSLKMEGWLAFTPGVLTLGAGFLLPQFAAIVFVVLILMRSMFFSFRTLKPGKVDTPQQKAEAQQKARPLPRGKG